MTYTRGKSHITTSHPFNGLDPKGFLLLFLGLAVFMSSCLAAVSFYYVTALKSELAMLSSKLNCKVQTRTSFPQLLRSLEKSKEANSFIPYLNVLEGASSQVSCRPIWKEMYTSLCVLQFPFALGKDRSHSPNIDFLRMLLAANFFWTTSK